jgi:uncharacterized membrane protein YdjX (TVP38/TMEM64 family)
MVEKIAGNANPVHSRKAWRVAALITLLSVGLALLTLSGTVHSTLTELLNTSRSVIAGYPVLGPLLFVLLAALSAMLTFLSVTVLLPLSVVTWGEPLSIALLWVGWLLGGLFTYVLGRYFGRPVANWLGADKVLKKLESSVGPSTPLGIVLLFQLALPSEIPGYFLGLARYSVLKYLFALGIVELLYAVAAVHLGASFVERRASVVLATGIALAAISIMAFYLLRRNIPIRDSG